VNLTCRKPVGAADEANRVVKRDRNVSHRVTRLTSRSLAHSVTFARSVAHYSLTFSMARRNDSQQFLRPIRAEKLKTPSASFSEPSTPLRMVPHDGYMF
jgi:hypothetical protein